jgi:hypothetical protein
MERVELVQRVVDLAIERLEAGPPDHPLLKVDRLRLRRLLAEAHYRDLRKLRHEIEADTSGPPA